jgi:ATP-dependent DNA helicase RecQ
LIENLATAIAERGQLPSLGSLGRVHHDGGRPGRANSAQRLAVLWDAFTVPEELRSRLGDLPSGPVLLVDDQIDSRWTMTVCARALRLAGAQSVLPFALAGQG